MTPDEQLYLHQTSAVTQTGGGREGREGDIIMELHSSPAQHRTDVCKFNKLYHPARRPGNGSRLLLRGDSDGTSRNLKCDIVVMVVMVVSRLLPRQFGLKIFLFCISQIFFGIVLVRPGQ